MAALGGHDKMAAEQQAMGEYVQVVVTEDGTGMVVPEPQQQQVVVLQGGAAEEISPEILQSLAHSDTVYYVQPDGSLVAGGTLAEVTAARHAVQEQQVPAPAVPAPAPASPAPAPALMDAALQLKSVAEHVALKQGAPNPPAPRLIQHEDLKTICVQVPGLQNKPTTAPANVTESAPAPVSRTVVGGGGTVAGTQVVQIKVPPPPTPQQYVVKAVQSPIQVLIQQPKAQLAKPKPPDTYKRAESPEDPGCCVAHHHHHGGRKPGGAMKAHKDAQKRKKTNKIKTRSGRISRPPKHKAKDYKFLKVGDSIQDSSADTSDYSELSSEEEDSGKVAAVGRKPASYTVPNSLFQCQKCEKSYMGKGGLFRHYRLYPAHGQLDSSFVLEARKNGDAVGTVEPKKSIPRPRKRLLEDPLNPTPPAPPTMAKDGLEMAPTSHRGRRYMPGRKFGRPRKLVRNGSVEGHTLTLKELIQQCEEKDLKEHVAPSVAKILSIYDFVILKVKQDQSDKPLFPRVYREFEKLHVLVKALAEDYVINMDQNTEKPLEVTDSRVAESLGISQDMTVKVTPRPAVAIVQEQHIKRDRDESSHVEPVPPSKRLKMDENSQLLQKKMDENQDEDVDHVSDDVAPVTGDAAESEAGEEPPHDSPPMPPQATVLGTDVMSRVIEQVTMNSEHDGREEAMEVQHTQEDAEAGESPEDPPASQSHDHPLNLSCHATEEAQTFQTFITYSDEVVAESSTDIPLSGEAQEAEISQETVTVAEVEGTPSTVSITHCTQATEPSRTFVSTTVPTTLVEAMCRDSSQVSFVEVGGALIPSTATTFTTEGLNMVESPSTFTLSHGQEYVFIHSSEDATTEEAVVIFDSTEAAETHLDTVVALVEM